MNNNPDEFLLKHGIKPQGDTYNYHLALGLYYFYHIDAMKKATEIEDGIVFDEQEVAILINGLNKAYDAVNYYKKKLNLSFVSFDVAEIIKLKGCRLDHGKLIGDTEEAARTGRMWIQNYLHKGGSAFMYEIGMYILFLLGENVEFVAKKQEE